MPVMRTYQCPECEGFFDHLHMRSTDEPPAFCPLCGASTADVSPEISAPHIARSIGKTADNVYRAMEQGSEHRAQLAADHLGVSASEMSAMKITDIKDNTREGDTLAVVASNLVSQFMQQTGAGGLQASDAAAGYAAASRQGAFAGAGSKTMSEVVSRHHNTAARLAAAGNMGRAKSDGTQM